ncbi:hypothetical protein BDQ17DRAFT_1377559 [Cyathus striatus]|nr:hypothetical protein BDQ17DRAFT_1377559 [Cyathus striatus]
MQKATISNRPLFFMILLPQHQAGYSCPVRFSITTKTPAPTTKASTPTFSYFVFIHNSLCPLLTQEIRISNQKLTYPASYVHSIPKIGSLVHGLATLRSGVRYCYSKNRKRWGSVLGRWAPAAHKLGAQHRGSWKCRIS